MKETKDYDEPRVVVVPTAGGHLVLQQKEKQLHLLRERSSILDWHTLRYVD